MIKIKLHDTVTTKLRQAIRGLADKRPLMEAIGESAVQLTKQAFSDASVRPAPWPARRAIASDQKKQKSKKPKVRQLLILTGSLQASPRVVSVGETTVVIGSDRKYARIHQLGGTIYPKNGKALWIPGVGWRKKVTIPARPFFPWYRARPSEALKRNTGAVVMARMKRLGFKP